MGRKLTLKFQKIGELTKGEDGYYREKGGHIVIAKSCPETWYRPDEPGTQEEQWADIEAAFARKAKYVLLVYGAWAVMIIVAWIFIWR